MTQHGRLFSRILVAGLLIASTSFASEWKGKPDSSEVAVGGIAGVGVIDGVGNFTLLGTLAKKIVNQGFIPDVNNSVWLEAQLGPYFATGFTPWAYSAHLRWNFNKDAEWTFYALGGLGGAFIPTHAGIPSKIEMIPRLGIGTFWNVSAMFLIRLEVSHELVGLGMTFPF